jgi:hypothetical protein
LKTAQLVVEVKQMTVNDSVMGVEILALTNSETKTYYQTVVSMKMEQEAKKQYVVNVQLGLGNLNDRVRLVAPMEVVVVVDLMVVH